MAIQQLNSKEIETVSGGLGLATVLRSALPGLGTLVADVLTVLKDALVSPVGGGMPQVGGVLGAVLFSLLS